MWDLLKVKWIRPFEPFIIHSLRTSERLFPTVCLFFLPPHPPQTVCPAVCSSLWMFTRERIFAFSEIN